MFMSLNLIDLFAVSATALITAILFWGIRAAMLRRHTARRGQATPRIGQVSFLLDGDALIDCSPEGTDLLQKSGDNSSTRSAVITALEPAFPKLAAALEDGISATHVITAETSAAMWLELEPLGDRVRISICGTAIDPQAHLGAVLKQVENTELLALREITKNAPQLMWRTDSHEKLVWANDAYLATCDACADLSTNIPKLPSKPLFIDLEQYVKLGLSTARCSVKLRDDEVAHWYDITAIMSSSGTQYFASDADSIVLAELGQRKFVQTLSQTFAQLSIGLAIFDRRRQLATFNPALLDMTALPFEFLSSRPSVDAMLDRLREHRMLPEPKNYATWREQFSAMEQAAKDGTYSENWNLPDGQTFRVTGRPHPDGAFALLFEDISAEISLTRRFRSEIETSQAVLDTLEDAFVVFSNSGNLVLANRAYCNLWDTDLEQGLNRHDLRVELRKWQSRCTPTRIWTNLREFTSQMGMRQPWTNTAILDDGRQITCVANPIRGGMTMIRFHFERPVSPALKKLAHVDNALIASKG